MTKTREIYRCSICGNIVEVLHEGAVLSCCGKPLDKSFGGYERRNVLRVVGELPRQSFLALFEGGVEEWVAV